MGVSTSTYTHTNERARRLALDDKQHYAFLCVLKIILQPFLVVEPVLEMCFSTSTGNSVVDVNATIFYVGLSLSVTKG